jgi:putative membrane protein
MFRFVKMIFAVACIAWLCATVVAQQDSNSKTSDTKASSKSASADTKFMKEAAEGGLAEVSLGQLAADKGSSNDVKAFGQRMVSDHTKANDQLKQIASQKKIDLPQDLNAKDKAKKAALEKLSGDQFDREYMKAMVADHKKDVSDFQRESTSGHDPDVKNFAAQTLPTLKEHLQQAQSIEPKATASR